MTKTFLVVFATISMVLALPSTGKAQSDGELQIGDIYDVRIGSEFKGWTSQGGGLLKDDQNLAYQLFRKGKRKVLLVVKPLSRTPRGGFKKKQILHKMEIEVPSGKKHSQEDCSFLDHYAAVTFVNSKSNIATGYFALPTGIQVWQWVVNWDYCSVP